MVPTHLHDAYMTYGTYSSYDVTGNAGLFVLGLGRPHLDHAV
jgi:hypothetical protein